MALAGTILFVFFLVVGLLATLLGLPGTLVVVVDVFVYGALTGFEKTPWWLIVLLFLLSIAAETVDNVLGAWGVKRYQGTSRGVVGAIIGGIIGAILGGSAGPFLAMIGLPAGPAGAVAMFCLGPVLGGMVLCYVGALVAERTAGKEWRDAAEAAKGAFIGRVLAVAFKVAVVIIMVMLALVAVFAG